ncbi:MAG TPA: zinc-binding dehydrogenase [Chloroflexota bacterium]|nr:zinc-binding dehydrogenase [Chloroflexota bacterium]
MTNETMNAARLYGARDLRMERVAVPVPTPGQALVRVRAVSVCGSDLHYYREAGIGDSRPKDPLVLGHELAGEVMEMADSGSDGAHRLAPGTLVAIDPNIACEACEHCLAGNPNLCPHVRFAGTPPTDGGLQEYLAWPAHLLRPLPSGMSAEVGALLEPLGVCIHALDLAHVRLASTVAVLGAGTIGLLVTKLAALSGASRVFTTDVLPARLAVAQAFGAHEVVNASQHDPVAIIRDRTGGRGVDVVIECAGAPQTPRQAVEPVRPGGTIVLVGIPSDDRTEFPASQARRKGVTIKLSRRMKHVYDRAISLVEAGLVDLPQLVSHRYPLNHTPDAFKALDRGDGVVKAVILA